MCALFIGSKVDNMVLIGRGGRDGYGLEKVMLLCLSHKRVELWE